MPQAEARSTGNPSFHQALARIFAGLGHIHGVAGGAPPGKGTGTGNTNLSRISDASITQLTANSGGSPETIAKVLSQAQLPLGEVAIELQNFYAARLSNVEQELLAEAEATVANIRIAHAIATIR